MVPVNWPTYTTRVPRLPSFSKCSEVLNYIILKREERQRQEKIEDWDRHKRGLGYRSKTKATETASKSLKRDTSNPLMGHGSSGGRFIKHIDNNIILRCHGDTDLITYLIIIQEPSDRLVPVLTAVGEVGEVGEGRR